MSKVAQACDCFKNGFNCSQAILSTYCEPLGLDKETALKIACGFGAGMGRLGETCGAVTGAFLLISLKHGSAEPYDNKAKEKTYGLIQEFTQKFTERNASICCKELLGVDLLTGDKILADERVSAVCPKMVKDAAEIIEAIL